MARAVERIEQDLATLEEAIALLASELYSTYSKYLTFLGQAVRQQLILASYQVCTHGYPESFLSLSFNHRQKLQQSLRQLGEQAQEQLLSHLERSKNFTKTEATDEPEQTVGESPVNSEQPQEQAQEQLPKPFEMTVGSDAPPDALETPGSRHTPPTKPEQLVRWQEQMEEAIAQTLQTISLETNRLLQRTGIIPDKLPAAVLEAAAKVEASGEGTPGSPNLLNLLMETDSDGDSEDSTLTRIVAINLRLSEIEFADPTLSAGRNQIRKLSVRVTTIQREYHKKLRERAVAQAEAAWRSSWFDD
jgi:hypothetical protein